MSEEKFFITGLMVSNELDIKEGIEIVNDELRTIKLSSHIYDFDFSDYYKEEFGEGLKKVILVGDKIQVDELSNIKNNSNSIEKQYRKDGGRTMNIDPGFITLSKLALYTTKNYSSSIPIDDKINCVLELIYHNGSFIPLNWTYPDFEDLIPFFNSVRENYIKRVDDNI